MPSPFWPCAFFVFGLAQSPFAAVASPVSWRAPPPRKPRPSTLTVAPFPKSRFCESIASTPPAAPFHASAVSPPAIVGAAYCGTRITWKRAPPPVV
ncbi:MAG: hypothetical protein M3154_04655 [Candidatus Eremiobacteraeota bacterium]|nr:hypothetical protein [Candidatus Eremiobacteraeota bacterium]